MKKKRRENEAFSISFLDVITCGFGAIILLLLIARTGDSPILESAVESMHGIVRELQVQLFEIRGEARILNRDLDAKHEQRSEWEQRVARLQAELAQEELRYNSIRDDSAVGVIIKGEFELALQQLTEEMKRLLAQKDRVRTDLIGGIPVDSEYVIFIIDTSGSMVNYHWENMIDQLITTLDVYPRLKGIQIMSDMGEYLFSRYRRTWIPDTEGRRKVIINTLRTWRAFSNSSPVEGITRAIRAFYDPRKEDQYLRVRRRVYRTVNTGSPGYGRAHQPEGQGRQYPGAHPCGRFSCSLQRGRTFPFDQQALCFAYAPTDPRERWRLRRPE